MALSLGFTSSAMAQTIQIDSTFTADGEIFPFGQVDTIYGLSISGSVQLLSDTSLVRVILTDDVGNEWMVYEAYPMIVVETSFDIENECDESCFSSGLVPFSLKIFISNAEIIIDSCTYAVVCADNPTNSQYQYKAVLDYQKSQSMNNYIESQEWNWIADTTYLSRLYYYEKKNLFGPRYNLLGFDYYAGGVYYSKRIINPSVDNSELVRDFDWREKHDAHLNTSKYWDNNPDKHWINNQWVYEVNGWMTGIRNQDDTHACGIFSSVACFEAMINLYYNHHVDYEYKFRLSERYAYNCSPYNTQLVGCVANEGKHPDVIFNFFKSDGAIPERCYPWRSPYCDGIWPSCESNDSLYSICPTHDTIIFIDSKNEIWLSEISANEKAAFLKQKLIELGPIVIVLNEGVISEDFDHAVCLTGFETNEYNIVNWIMKNSWGISNDDPNKGYFISPLNLSTDIFYRLFAINTPLHTQPENLFTIKILDEDNDGYYNWGIGPRPEGVPNDYQQDSNDNDNRTGPYDENYYGIPVAPEIEVYYNIWQPSTVKNQGIVNVTGNNSNDISYTFVIKNPGTAQLNLKQYQLTGKGKVTIEYQNENGFFNIDEDDLPYMSVCMDNCTTQFNITLYEEAQPGALAHIRIHLNEFDMDDFYFTIIYNGCDTEEGEEEIDGAVTWSDPFRIQLQDVRIKQPGELTISGTVFLAEDVDIFVEAGGKLIIDGGKLTSSCGTLWNGIDVWGDPRMSQTAQYQGTVSMINDGCIEYALRGIETARYYEERKCHPTGGIISCQNALFKDNLIDVYFFPYTNRHPVTQDILPNFSRFSKTTFETTDDLYDIMALVPSSHIFMDEVGGIVLSGCTFGNYSTQNDQYRGKGIESHGSGYIITNDCADQIHPCPEPIPSRFENLDYGIRAFNNNGYFTVTVDSAEFINNYRGIFTSLANDVTIIKNRFLLNTVADHISGGDTLIGIYTDRSMRYQIEENLFTGDDPEHFDLIGMHITNSGPDYNEVYNNTFEKLTYGIIAAGENRDEDGTQGLCIKCNDFRDCITDIFITPRKDENGNSIITNNTGIATYQGLDGSLAPPGVDPEAMGAGNTFTANEYSSIDFNFYNDPELDLIIYTHQPNTFMEKLSPDPYRNIEPIVDIHVSYTKDISCPSNLNPGGIQPELLKSNYSNENLLVTAYQDTLSQYVDGGDTYGLLGDIQNSSQYEALLLRQQLLDESPYLSKDVLKSAVNREDVLLNAMIRDVLVANPHSVKSADILNDLEYRSDPLPDYMMSEIMSGTSVLGSKEQLERKLSMHQSFRAGALSNLTRYYKNDTLQPSFDSLTGIFNTVFHPNIRYQLAFCHLFNKDTIEARNVLNEIPSVFSLDAGQMNTHARYVDLFEVLVRLQADSTWLDSTLTASLLTLSQQNDDIPGIYSRNLLIKYSLITYDEPVYLPEFFKRSRVWNKPGHAIPPKVSYLKVFPNPAGSYFIIEYDLMDKPGDVCIKISDLTGRVISELTLNDSRNQRIYDTRKLSAGIYLIKLFTGNQLLEVKKVIISR